MSFAGIMAVGRPVSLTQIQRIAARNKERSDAGQAPDRSRGLALCQSKRAEDSKGDLAAIKGCRSSVAAPAPGPALALPICLAFTIG